MFAKYIYSKLGCFYKSHFLDFDCLESCLQDNVGNLGPFLLCIDLGITFLTASVKNARNELASVQKIRRSVQKVAYFGLGESRTGEV